MSTATAPTLTLASAPAHARSFVLQKRTVFLIAYLLFAVLPIYWMVNMSFKTNNEILSSFSFWPQDFTWANYKTIFTDVSWYSGYINSLIYVAINTRDLDHRRAAGGLRVHAATGSSATSTCSSGC